MTIFTRMLAVFAALLLTGCSYEPYGDLSCTTDDECGLSGVCLDGLCVAEEPVNMGPGAAVTMNVNPARMTVAPGETATFEAEVLDGEGSVLTDAEVVWSSDSESVATIDGGVVTGVEDGMTTIRATYENLEASATVTVYTPVESIDVEPETLEIPLGSTEQITATGFDSAGNELMGRTFTFQSQDQSVARVNFDGVVTGAGEGTTTILIQSDQASATVDVTVNATTPSSVEITPRPTTFSINDSIVFEAVVRDESGRVLDPTVLGAEYVWTSAPQSLQNYVSISDSSFRLRPQGMQVLVTATISVQVIKDDVILDDEITFDIVEPDVDTVTATSGATAELGVGETRQATFEATDVNGDPVRFPDSMWESSDTDVATVDENGNIEAIAPGTATITLTVDGVSTTIEVTVSFELASISAGVSHACGLTVDGKAWCWGDNSKRQLGDQSNSDRELPVEVQTTETFTQIVTGDRATCGLNMNGNAFCWGEAGMLGDDQGGDQSTPVPVATSETFTMLDAQFTHVCGVTTTDAIMCWGNGNEGQLGDGNSSNTDAPVTVTQPGGVTGWKTVSVGEKHTCAVDDSDRLFCWGFNDTYQLGDGTTDGASEPVQITIGQTVGQLALAQNSSCALASMALYCWGADDQSQTATDSGAAVQSPQMAQGGLSFSEIDMGAEHGCGIDAATGDVYCWGRFDDGRLGTGASANQATPTAVTPALSATSIDTGSNFSCAVDATNTPYCWGANGDGQLGIGGTMSQDAPSVVWPAP